CTNDESYCKSDGTLVAEDIGLNTKSSPEVICSSQPESLDITLSVASKELSRSCSQQSGSSSLRRHLMDTQFRQQFMSFVHVDQPPSQ
ncbi:hypothetical protein SK128_007276, partial [Halocaridina rubra]